MEKRLKRGIMALTGVMLLVALTAASSACSFSEQTEPIDREENVFPEQIAKEPVILTSGGQSADIHVVDVLLRKSKIVFERKEQLQRNELEGYETLLIALGGSTKGLASAGVSPEEELERLRGLAEETEDRGMSLVVLHIGGSSRRGEVSDQFLPDILSEGDADGKMREILKKNQVPFLYVENQIDAIEPLTALFEK